MDVSVGSGGDLAVAVGVTQSLLDIETRGLLGNVNGNPDDDLLTPNGTVLAKDTNEEVIFKYFGQKCKFRHIFYFYALYYNFRTQSMINYYCLNYYCILFLKFQEVQTN